MPPTIADERREGTRMVILNVVAIPCFIGASMFDLAWVLFKILDL